jgi:hypothetical protein
MRSRLLASLSFSLLLLSACSDAASTGSGGGTTSSSTTDTTSVAASTSSGTGGADAGSIDKSENCAAVFGDALTNSYGRVDGTVRAVVKPTDTHCPLPNNDHVILQVDMNGAVYRMVINVQSSFGDPNVQYLATTHALVGPAWAEGWHTGVALDYVADLGAHAGDFTPHPLAELSDILADAFTLGQKVSVYATSSGGASAHLVHRNGNMNDGAVVLDPDAASPTVLLFHFADQSF